MNRLLLIANVYNFQSFLEEDNFACKSSFHKGLELPSGKSYLYACLIQVMVFAKQIVHFSITSSSWQHKTLSFVVY